MQSNFRSVSIAVLAAFLAANSALAQTKPAPVYTPTSLKAEPGLPRTPDGHPDFQDVVWESDYFAGLTGIPFVTPAELVITEEQSKTAHEALVKMMASFPGVDLDPEIVSLMGSLKGSPIVRGQRRSRVLVMPADGKMPITPAAQAEIARSQGIFTAAKTDNPEDRSLGERCILTGGDAPFQGPTIFNPLRIVQTRDYVVIHTENADEVRIAPFSAKHGPAELGQPLGDSIARWDGDTLVIETTSAPANRRLRVTPFGGIIVNPEARITERLTRVSKDELIYQFTVEDPKVFSGPWLGEFSLFRSAGRMYPSVCAEGNYALANILSGARYQEAQLAMAITDTTAEPAVKWTSAFDTVVDKRSWAVMTRKDNAGEARVGLRIERLEAAAVPAGAAVSLSELNVFAVDCAGQRVKMLTQATYAAHNLSGAKVEKTQTGDWAAAATRPAVAAGIRQACS